MNTLLRLAFCAVVAGSVAAGPIGEKAVGSQPGDGLGDLQQRLRGGDRSAIDALLARTRPASVDLAESEARIDALRRAIEELGARRAARPTFPFTTSRREPPGAPAPEPAPGRVDGLREAQAWLRAGEPARALQAIPDRGPESLYVEARALERLGRTREALESYRSVASSALSPTLRARAEGDVRHLEWLASRRAAQGGRP